MKLNGISASNNETQFCSIRTDRNIVKQLSTNNKYSLIEPNQRAITDALKSLSKSKNPTNIQFLLKTASNLKYSTNIDFKKVPKNDWKLMITASVAALATSLGLMSDNLKAKINDILNNKQLNPEEKEIIALQKKLLKSINLQQIKDETWGSEQAFEDNLNYFITSSETSLKDKKYVMERLNYMLSDDYKINPQLENKKSVAIAEIVNDIAINTHTEKFPNIKAVNQRNHGTCAAISIVRKKLAYEDKPNFVDTILSELDNSDKIMIYDRTNLNSNKKIPIKKIKIDFDDAHAKGYRIIDASSMYWMQIASTVGTNNISFCEYTSFDKQNFDAKTDQFYNAKFADTELAKSQEYYLALLNAKSELQDYKAKQIKRELRDDNIRMSDSKNIKLSLTISNEIKNLLKSLKPSINTHECQIICKALLDLERRYSYQTNTENKYNYIINEESIIKKEKINNYLKDTLNIENIDKVALIKLFNLIEYYHETERSNNILKGKNYNISKASDLYHIAAVFRNQLVTGLDEETKLKEMLDYYNYNDSETLMREYIDKFIEKLEQDSPYSEEIIHQTDKIFTRPVNNTHDAIAALREIKNMIATTTSCELDKLYYQLGFENKSQALIKNIDNIKTMILNDDKEYCKYYEYKFHIKGKRQVIQRLEELQNELKNNDTDKYIKVFNLIGYKSQIQFLTNCWKEIALQLSENKQINGKYINTILNANNINSDEITNENFSEILNTILNNIMDSINSHSQFLQICKMFIKIKDKQGNVVLSIDPKDIIIKKYEDKYNMPKASELSTLQKHLDKINYDRATGEFKTHRKNLHDKTLYTFSNGEKETLKNIENNINFMYSEVTRDLRNIKKDIQEPLEELNRVIGVNSGDYWVSEISGGLSSAQQITLLECMTGKPHYSTKNIKAAIDKIKKSPFSGISSTSVYHNRFGMHAQYIADISPVKILTKDRNGNTVTTVKEVLFHDNTWGAIEKENVWTDSKGLERTDYSDFRGGTEGYITNADYRNGHLVDDILHKMTLNYTPEHINSKMYKKLKHPDFYETYRTTQYKDIILQGFSPEAKNVAATIQDEILIPSVDLIDDIEEILPDFTQEELKLKIKKLTIQDNSWKIKYDELLKRIYAKDKNAITSKVRYDNLADTDYLKIALEKIALNKNYPISDLSDKLTTIKNVKELNKFKSIQKQRAINEIKYAFTKSTSSFNPLLNLINNNMEHNIETILKKYNLTLSEDDKDVLLGVFDFKPQNYNGSAKDGLEQFTKNMNKIVDAKITNPEANQVLKKIFYTSAFNTIYINSKDITNSHISNLINFIDKKYNPVSDTELIKIYREIQDMTSEEFKQQIMPYINTQYMNIKNITGYDILRRIQHEEESERNALLNTVYYDSLDPETEHVQNDLVYQYNRFFRTARYKIKYDFNSIYKEFQNDLSALDLPKLFNKYKDTNFTKYNCYPAYPKFNHISEEFISSSYDNIINTLEHNIEIYNYIQSHFEMFRINTILKNYNNKYESEHILTNTQHKNLQKLILKIHEISSNIEDESNICEICEEIIQLSDEHDWDSYKPLVTTLTDEITKIQNTNSKSDLKRLLNKTQNEISNTAHINSKILIQQKYQDNFIKTINELKKAYIKQNGELVIQHQKDLYNQFLKYHIGQNPQELLNLYITTGAKDSELQEFHTELKKLLERTLAYAMIANVQEILMDAVGDGVASNIKTLLNMEDQVIVYIINKLIIDNNEETALMFADKLGLNEKYVTYITQNFKVEELQQIIDRINTTTDNYQQFFDAFQEKVQTTMQHINTGNDTKLLNQLQIALKNLAQQYSIDKIYTNIYKEAIQHVKKEFAKQENINKDTILESYLNIADTAVADLVNNSLENDRQQLQNNEIITNLINQMSLKPHSKADKLRNEYNKKIEQLSALYTQSDDLHQD